MPRFITILLFIVTASLQAQSALPCQDNPLFSKLDFWLGDWEVYTGDTLSAYSIITKGSGDCTLHEDYKTLNGYSGRSMNYFDPADSLYKQIWVDMNNGVINFQELRSEPGYLLLEAVGSTQPLRMDYRLNVATDFVTQTMESSRDNGATWTNIFTGEYRPRIDVPTTADILINRSIRYHDPNRRWLNWRGELQVEEPRLQNPGRSSKVMIDNALSVFTMERAYGDNLLGFSVTPAGCSFSLNGRSELDQATLSEHRLNCSRAKNYQSFYRFLYGAPMALDELKWEQMAAPKLVELQGEQSILISLHIEDAPFSTQWALYFDPSTYQLKAMEYFPEGETRGDLLLFEDEFEKNGIKLHRSRHWYEDGKYQGSDIGF